MVDNFKQIKELLKFEDENDFYFLQVIQRKKDVTEFQKLGSNNSSRLIKAYYIYSIEQLEKNKEEIIELCKLFNARAGINLNRRNAISMSLEMMALLATNIKNSHYRQLHRLYSTICGQHHSDKDKVWIIDINDLNFNVLEMKEFMRTQQPEGDKYIATIPSKGGCHIIVKPFDLRQFSIRYPDLDIHKNNPTNLYIP